MKSLKIALVILHADASRGGAERYTIDLANALAKAGHDVSLLATSFAEQPSAVRQVALPANALTRTGRYLRFLDSLGDHLARDRYDIVHAMLPVRQCDVYHPHAGLAIAALTGRKKRLEAMVNPRRRRFAAVEQELLCGSSPPVVLCLSEYVKRSIAVNYTLDEAHLPILFNAVDTQRFAAQQRDHHEKITALFVGQDFARKGVTQAVAAIAMIDDPRLALTIVGRKPASFHLPPTRRINLIGEVGDARPFYRAADFLVLPTRHDPCSLVVLEALATGLPVISTRFNGATEIMTDGVHGFVLDDPNDISALADRMKRMLDPQLRARMSAACLELRPKLAYEHHLATLMSIYSRIIEQRH